MTLMAEYVEDSIGTNPPVPGLLVDIVGTEYSRLFAKVKQTCL